MRGGGIMAENEDRVFKCDECQKTVYLMEAGRGKELKCCDKNMRELSEQEKKPYHPRFVRPGSP